MRLIATCALAFGVALQVCAVKVHINSGNPAYPFPQFLPYTYGTSHSLGNLATQNAEGVCHAEMEQDIRDAYQVHANEFATTGESWGGYDYIWTPYKSAYDCTEGDGYALLAAAYMADAVTFNGYWMCTHDKRRSRTKKYAECSDNAMNYDYGPFAIGDDGAGGNTAADGDVDVALALYVAYKQWGEFMRKPDGTILNDACGNPISYKEAMIEVIRGLVAMSTKFPTENPMRVNTGLIGLDGYPKGGDTWNEQTTYSTDSKMALAEDYDIFDMTKTGVPADVKTTIAKGTLIYPEFGSGDQQHVDYNAPAYYREFWELFEQIAEEEGIPNFEIEQFKRGEASSDWQMGELLKQSPYSIPTAGWVAIDKDNNCTFTNFNQGEDYRHSWRTLSNYVWHGNPTLTWDPTTHKANAGSNTYEYDACVRMAKWMNDPSNWNTTDNGSICIEYGSIKNLPYSGPATIRWQNDPNTGIPTKGQDFYCSLSMQTGTGSFAAIGAQDYELMGLAYRECNIKWDTKGNATDIDVPAGEECNLGKTSNYMHGWARQLGMMALSGNYHAPSAMNGGANMKIYRAIKDSVTYCYTGDTITYLLDYRNYGSVDATGVKIVERVPQDFIVTEVKNGGIYDKATHTITWNIGSVAGYHSDGNEAGAALNKTKANFNATIGQVSYRAKAGTEASGRYCTTADITCTNGSGWTSNEYPNYITATMQRNCVDVVKRSLKIEKSVDRAKINPGNAATYTINFENSSEAGWIDGGRPRVNVSWAFEDQGNQAGMKIRLFNDAIESYINYGNYRISYYLYDASITGLGNGGWAASPSIYEGGEKTGVTLSHEDVVEGSDEKGKWNQRLMIQFAPLFVTTTMVTSWNTGNPNCTIHKGGDYPLRGVWLVNGNNYSNKVVWSDDWSYGAKYNDADGGNYFPISPSWQKLDENGKTIEEPITKWLTCGCTESATTVDNVLVEEYDGYVWRRVLGNGPMAGRDVENVYVRDTLPKGLTFGDFLTDCPLEDMGATLRHYTIADGREVVEWYSPKMQVKQKGTIKYSATVNFPSGAECMTDDEDIINTAYIEADKNSPIGDTAKITVTCAKVPDPIVPTTLKKTADKEKYTVGDDITYTLEYEQTHGSIFDDAAKDYASDWTNTGNVTNASGVLTIGQGGKAQFDYSKSKNLFVTLHASMPRGSSTKDSETIFYFRNDMKIGFYLNYDGGAALVINAYKGSTLLKSADIVTKSSEFDLKFDINEDIIRVWLDKDTSTIAGFTLDEGVSTDEGYFGIQAPSNGSCTISKVHVHTDYAYNLFIRDIKPEEIDFVEADNDGKLEDGEIVWTFEQGKANPIPFGTQYTVTWTGTVKVCDESIINVAYVQLMGHDDSEIRAQAVSECGEVDCELTKVTIALDNETLCEKDSTILRVTATAKGSYIYTYYLDDEKIASFRYDTLIVKKGGEYKVVVTSTTDESCTKTSSAVTLKVNENPTGKDYDFGTVCKNQTFSQNAEYSQLALYAVAQMIQGHQIRWYYPNGDEIGDFSEIVDIINVSALSPGLYDYRMLNIETKTGCRSDSFHITFTIADTANISLNDETICENTKSALDPGASEDAADIWKYEWSDGSTDQVLKTETAGVYTVEVTNSAGCVSTASAEVKVQEELEVDLGGDTTVCKASLPYTIKTAAEYDSYEWNDGSTESELSVDEAGTYSVKVTKGLCTGAQTVEVKVSEVANPTGTFTVSYLISDSTESGTFDKTLGEMDPTYLDRLDDASHYVLYGKLIYKWYDEDMNLLEGEPIPVMPADRKSTELIYYVTVENVYGCVSEPMKITVPIIGVPYPKAEDVAYCLGETAEALKTEVSEGDDPTVEYILQWYDAEDNLIGTTAPTPSTETAGATVYYVSQKSTGTDAAESGKRKVTVSVYGVATPDTTGNRYDYCAGDTHDALVAISGADKQNYVMGDSLIWTVGGEAWDGKSEIEWATGKTSVSVMAAYTIAEGHVCESEKVEFDINVTELKAPTGDLVVNYVKSEGKTGDFKDLLTKNPTVATPDEGNTLVWYDAEGNVLDGVPTPQYDATWPEGEDVSLTYYVAQTDGKCVSEKVKIDVIISDSPIPTVSPVAYCQDATATALTAVINETVESADNYKLLWYTTETGEGTETAPTPTTDEVGEQTYYVAQQHLTSGAISTKAALKVTIHALPELTTTAIEAQCGGEVDLSKHVGEKNGLTVTYEYFDSETSTAALASSTVDKTGTYYVGAYYEINTTTTETAKCESKARVPLNVDIHDLSDLDITGDEMVCPGVSARLVATATSLNPGIVTYAWDGGAATEQNEYVTPAITGKAGEKKTFTVVASAGACTGAKALTKTFEVGIDRGVLSGAIFIQGQDVDLYKTCGGENITLYCSHENTGPSIKWTTTRGESVASDGTEVTVNPETTTQYVVTLTNVCEVSDTVTIEVKPITVTADWKDLAKTICEGNKFSATLNATGYKASDEGAYVKWYKDGEELTEQAGKLSISVAEATAEDAGTYTYKISNGVCELPKEEDAGTLEVVTNPTFTVTEEAVSCSGDAVDISVTLNEADAEIAWADGTTDANRTVSPTESTTYEFTVTRGNVCKVKGAIPVSVKAKPEVTVSDESVCEGGSKMLKARATGDDLTTYTWTNEAGETVGDAANLTVTPTETATYTIEVASASCGTARASATVDVIPTPELRVDSVALRSRKIVVLNETSATYEYRMDSGEWQEDNLFDKVSYALHTAYAKDENGCEGSLMFETKAPAISIPESFTPNSDGVNDQWDVSNIVDSYPGSTVTIYDRYGKKLVELSGDSSSWDGTYNGHAMPSTDYWYTVRIPEIVKVYTGHFTLLRSK